MQNIWWSEVSVLLVNWRFSLVQAIKLLGCQNVLIPLFLLLRRLITARYSRNSLCLPAYFNLPELPDRLPLLAVVIRNVDLRLSLVQVVCSGGKNEDTMHGRNDVDICATSPQKRRVRYSVPCIVVSYCTTRIHLSIEGWLEKQVNYQHTNKGVTERSNVSLLLQGNLAGFVTIFFESPASLFIFPGNNIDSPIIFVNNQITSQAYSLYFGDIIVRLNAAGSSF